MKLLIINISILLLFISIQCSAQQSGEFPLDKKVASSNYIIEGEVIKTESFINKDSNIYTAAFIKLSRIFKGDNIDSIVELVYSGGYYPGLTIPIQISTNGINLLEGEDGIFFLNKNNTANKMQDNLQSYLLLNVRRSFIHYQGGSQAGLEAGIYKDIVAITGQPIKVLGLNTLERPQAKKQQK